MTEMVVNWIWHLGSRDLCAIIGFSFIGLSAIAWFTAIPSRLGGSLDNIADAIREGKK